jgi:hypothetical protein
MGKYHPNSLVFSCNKYGTSPEVEDLNKMYQDILDSYKNIANK